MSRYWTIVFMIVTLLSYWLVFPFEVRPSLSMSATFVRLLTLKGAFALAHRIFCALPSNLLQSQPLDIRPMVAQQCQIPGEILLSTAPKLKTGNQHFSVKL